MSQERDHILVVDDEDSLRDLLQQVFSGKGYHVTTIGEPSEVEEGIIKAEKQSFPINIAFVDLYMPRGIRTGDQVVANLKEIRPNITSVIMSAHGSSLNYSDREHLISIGAYAIVDKPFELETFFRLIERIKSNGRDPIHRLVTQPYHVL